ncbi:MAG TPA: hypothetical protein ENJ80_11170 [Gammaproteobacteria bacterium]|nr:hypothetical protein [Gammaproteobacteria bacterium]
MNPYYGVRRLGPYLGIIQVIDVGDACAYSTNGHSWRIRQQTSSGRFRWGIAQISANNMDDICIVNADNLVQALRDLPRVPFPVRDRFELWLLNHQSRKPLALLRTCYKPADMECVTDPHWRPFLRSDTRFVSMTLAELGKDKAARDLPILHRDRLESQVNEASRPFPVAQWFERLADGRGVGHAGLRLEPGDAGRILAADDFPELLVSEDWPDPVQAGVVTDYHDWYAASLLAHQNLSHTTRVRLERAACRRPQALLSSYPLIPKIIDQDAIDVALVSARLMNAS